MFILFGINDVDLLTYDDNDTMTLQHFLQEMDFLV